MSATKVVTTQATFAHEKGVPAEVVARYTAQGWVVRDVGAEATYMTHPQMTGVQLAVMAR